MKFISLFAGIGGFDLALIRQGHECVWANEWDKYAAQIYDKNFCSINREENRGSQEIKAVGGSKRYPEPESLNAKGGQFSQYGNNNGNRQKPIDTRDIRTVPTSEIPDPDLLVGGFPCQAFSIAGKRKGFDDTRGTLFFEIARILREKHTRLFILENVKGLLSHDNGNTFKTIISTLVELGYDIQWQVLNSKNFGVPQNRERVFIIGNLRGTGRPEVFPVRQDGGFSDSEHKKQFQWEIQTNRYKREQSDFNSEVLETGENRPIHQLNQPTHSNGTYVCKRPAQKINVVGILETDGWEKRNESTRRVYGTDGISPTIPTAQGGGVMAKIMEQSKIRRLTPIECERLQGFPDNWTAGVSDTQRYKMCGNAVTVNVVSYLVSKF